MKISNRRRTKESGQAVVLTVLGVSIALMGALGLAIDGSNLYAQRQLAQAAADAAAQAGMMDIFESTGQFTAAAGTTYTCSTTTPTPCYYAMALNGFNTTADTVTYTPNPSGVSVSGLSPDFTVNLLQVTVTRNVPATVMRLLGSSTFPVRASATAAIVYVDSPVPMIVTHPSNANSLYLSGTGNGPKIKICGGPTQSIQVNSTNASAVGWTGNPWFDLTHAGPADSGNCTTGTGASFGVRGGPVASSTGGGANTLVGCSGGAISGCTYLGSTGFYIDPSPAIPDPLASVSAPADPSIADSSDVNPTSGTVTVAAGSNGCPSYASPNCTVYFPGKYTSDIKLKGSASAGAYAVFAPGIYYMYGTNFTLDSNSEPFMLTGYTDSSTTGAPSLANCCGTGTNWGQNMLVYMTGPSSSGACINNPSANQNTTGTFTVNSNAGHFGTGTLTGAPTGSTSKGIFLFIDRNGAANSGHSIDGGASLQITGTFYLTSSCMFNYASVFPTLNFQGNGSGTTKLTGEIIASEISMSGTPGITMNLNSAVSYKLDKVALVQ